MQQTAQGIPERAWGGRSWITACCGGCCLGLVVVFLLFLLVFKWVITIGGVPIEDSARAVFEQLKEEVK